MRSLWATALALGWLLGSAGLAAHHSFAAEFDINQPVTLTGVLTRMDWINPHGWVYVDVKDADGTVTSWAVETGAPSALQRRGFRRTDFPVGIEVHVTGYRAKSGKPVANGRSIKLPDGRDFFLSPETGVQAPGADSTPGR
jgi:hypothetical protein